MYLMTSEPAREREQSLPPGGRGLISARGTDTALDGALDQELGGWGLLPPPCLQYLRAWAHLSPSGLVRGPSVTASGHSGSPPMGLPGPPVLLQPVIHTAAGAAGPPMHI